MLTVLCWLWSQPGGRTAYTAEHVNIWADMVDRHLAVPHRLACVTATPEGIDPRIQIIDPPGDFEDITVPTWPGEKPQCMRRIAMFRPDAESIFGARFVSMDIDCVISGNLDGLFDRPEPIVLYASPQGSYHQPRPYNGSMLMMTAGARPEVYRRLTQQAAEEAGRQYVGSDQAWISHVLGAGEATWNEADGVIWWGRWREGAQGRLLFFPGTPKPWGLVESYDFIRDHYHRNAGGRCLVLGYAPSVWSDLEAATGKFDHVIASPEAAEHWPGDIFAIVKSDAEAERLIARQGFDDVVFCGRTEGEAA